MSKGTVIAEAEFNPKVCSYWLISGTIICIVCIVTIPVLPVWWIIGTWATRRYLDRLSCTLTDRSLEVSRGIFVRTEKTVPLEKITDMGMVQGPIMRAMDLHTLSVETAGQSGPGSLVRLTGIVDAPAFRARVLEQRDRMAERMSTKSEDGDRPHVEGGDAAVLTEIRDILVRIESRMADGK